MIQFYAYIDDDGEVKNPKVVENAFNTLTPGRWRFRIERSNKRTLPMNSYLHGVLIPEFKNALNSVGYDEVRSDEQAKEIMKAIFLKASVVNKETGEMLEYVKNTSDLTTEEMSNLFDEVIKFCAENMNYQILYPNEQLKIV